MKLKTWAIFHPRSLNRSLGGHLAVDFLWLLRGHDTLTRGVWGEKTKSVYNVYPNTREQLVSASIRLIYRFFFAFRNIFQLVNIRIREYLLLYSKPPRILAHSPRNTLQWKFFFPSKETSYQRAGSCIKMYKFKWHDVVLQAWKYNSHSFSFVVDDSAY